MRARCRLLAAALPFVLALSACSNSVTGANNNGPWVGNWLQVNFLATDDNGVWDQDDLSGIGFVAEVTPSEWTLIDEDGNGCAVTMSYSVDSNDRFSRQAIRAGSKCPALPLNLLKDSGRFEFSNNDTVMIEWFDVQPPDDIAAFKWVRR